MNRRQLLKVLGVGAVTAGSLTLLEACSPAAPAAKPTDAPAKPADAAKPAAPAAATAPAAAAKPADARQAGRRGGPRPARQARRQLTVVVQNDWVTLRSAVQHRRAGRQQHALRQLGPLADRRQGRLGADTGPVAEWDPKPDSSRSSSRRASSSTTARAWDAKAAKWNLDRLIFHPASACQANLRGVDVSKEDAAALDKLKADAERPVRLLVEGDRGGR